MIHRAEGESQMTIEDRRSTAIHEAAHVVVAWALDLPVGSMQKGCHGDDTAADVELGDSLLSNSRRGRRCQLACPTKFAAALPLTTTASRTDLSFNIFAATAWVTEATGKFVACDPLRASNWPA